jgi:hypothetical protein
MACMSLLTPSVAMTTTQFTRAIPYRVPALGREQNADTQPLRMNWIVVTDRNGRRSLRMRWLHSGTVTHGLSTL